jgi:hypothetical protein
MREKQMFGSASSAGVVAAGISCFFIGVILVIWSVWDSIESLGTNILAENLTMTVILSIFIWFLGWYCLHTAWKQRPVSRRTAHKIASILIISGVASTIFTMIRIVIT